ncbi:DnaJ domain-containing protein, partial [Myxococcota bacterium]|nr:DnaJ domain-containing protein [Myxococcota bacterium]
MLIRKEDIPKLAPQGSWNQMPSDPMELFILSKVDAKTRVEEMAILCAKSIDDTITVIKKLVDKGILVFPGKTLPPVADTDSGENFCISPKWLVPIDKCNVKLLEDTKQLPMGRAAELLRVYHSLDSLNPFQVFGIDETATDRDVKRAYQKLTLRYHPDRYYGKDLGGFKRIIEEIFKNISDSYDMLSTQEGRDGLISVYGEWLQSNRDQSRTPEPVDTSDASASTRSDVEKREARRAQIRKRLKDITSEIPQFTMEDLKDDTVEAMSPEDLLERKKRHRRKFTPLGVKDRATRSRQHLKE